MKKDLMITMEMMKARKRLCENTQKCPNNAVIAIPHTLFGTGSAKQSLPQNALIVRDWLRRAPLRFGCHVAEPAPSVAWGLLAMTISVVTKILFTQPRKHNSVVWTFFCIFTQLFSIFRPFVPFAFSCLLFASFAMTNIHAQKITSETLSAQEYLKIGNDAYESGYTKLAVQYYQKAIDINPNYADAYNNIGLAYSDLNNYKEAIYSYQKAIDIDSNYATAYYNMGLVYGYLENYKELIRYAQKAIDIDPNYASAYYNMGRAYFQLKNYKEAIYCLKKTIEIVPNQADAHNLMGIAYANLENHNEAIRCFKKAIIIDPNDLNVYNNMGISYSKLGNKQEAVNCFKKAARLGDKDAQNWLQNNGLDW